LSAEAQEHVKKSFVNNPFHRTGDPYNDVAPAVAFFASDDSRWITGQNILTDGGVLINA